MPKWNKPKEQNVVDAIFRFINKLPVPHKAWKNHGSRYGVRGMPDIQLLLLDSGNLHFYCFECKRQGTAVTPGVCCLGDSYSQIAVWKMQGATDIQCQELAEFQQAGAECYVVETVQQVKDILKGVVQ